MKTTKEQLQVSRDIARLESDKGHQTALELASISGKLQAYSIGLKENYLDPKYFASRIDEVVANINEIINLNKDSY